MTLEEIKQFLKDNKDNKEVAAYLEELSAPTTEQIEGFLDTDEGKKVLQPRLDSNFTKGLNTWKEKNLQGMLDKAKEEGKKEANPDETPEQKRIRELEEKIVERDKENNTEKLRNTAFSFADKKELPKDQRILDRFLGDDEESTTSNLQVLEEVFNESVKTATEKKFKENGRDVPGGDKTDKSTGTRFAEGANKQKEVPEVDIWK